MNDFIRKNILPVDVLAWRDKLGATQQQLADKLGVTRVTVARWETGANAIPDDVDAKCSAIYAARPVMATPPPKAAAPMKISLNNSAQAPQLMLYEGGPNNKGRHHPERLQLEGFLVDPVPGLPAFYLKDFGGRLMPVRDPRPKGWLSWSILEHPVYLAAVDASRAWYRAHGKREWKDSSAALLRAHAQRLKQPATQAPDDPNKRTSDLPTRSAPDKNTHKQPELASLPSRR